MKLANVIGIAGICMLLLQCDLFKSSRPIPDNLSNRIKTLCEQYPPPKDFVPIDEPRAITKTDRGSYGGWYRSSKRSDEVLNYYSEQLSKADWEMTKESSYNISSSSNRIYVTYRKDGFYIALEFTDEKPGEMETTYGITCGFRP